MESLEHILSVLSMKRQFRCKIIFLWNSLKNQENSTYPNNLPDHTFVVTTMLHLRSPECFSLQDSLLFARKNKVPVDILLISMQVLFAHSVSSATYVIHRIPHRAGHRVILDNASFFKVLV